MRKAFIVMSFLLVGAGCNTQMPKQTIGLPPSSPSASANTPTPSIPTLQVPNQPSLVPASVGSVSRHAGQYISMLVSVEGFVLAQHGSYVIVSDEATGGIGRYDLPVTGSGVDALKVGSKYIFQGVLYDKGLAASNDNPDHLELTLPVEPQN